MTRISRWHVSGMGSACLALGLQLLVPDSPAAEGPQLVSRRGIPVPAVRTGAGVSLSATPSRDGRYVVFQSTAPDLVPGGTVGPGWEVFRRDLVESKTERVSVFSSVGGGLTVSPDPSASHDGGSIAFVSQRPASVGGDTNGVADVFVRRMSRGEPELVSVRSDGKGSGDGPSGPGEISGDGRFVVFESLATDLVSAVDTNGVADVFLRELETGTTFLLSARPTGSPSGDRRSYGPTMSADAGVVVFRSLATDLTPPHTGNPTDLYVWTRADRALKRIVLPGAVIVSGPDFVHVTNPVLSEDGRWLAFRATAPGTTVTALDGVWVWDLSAGTGVLASNDRAGTGVLGEDDLTGPVMNRDGQILAFEVNEGVVTRPTRKIKVWKAGTGLQSLESLVVGDPANAPEPESSEMPVLDATGSRLAFLTRSAVPGTPVTGAGTNRLFIRELATGVTTVFPAGEAAEAWDLPFAEFIGDGSRLLFQSEAPLAPGAVDANRALDVFVGFPGTFAVTPVSLANASAAVIAPAVSSMMPRDGAGVSSSGRYVLYGTTAQDVVPGAANPGRDVFRFDRETGATLRVSRTAEGGLASGPSTPIALSADGRIALFLSLATNLVAGDRNGVEDLFRANLETGGVELVNAQDGGTEFSQRAITGVPQFSADGRCVAFLSTAVDLVPGMSGSGPHLLLRDTELRKTYWVSSGNAQGSGGTVRGFALGESGRYLAFASGNATAAGVAVYDRQAGGRVPLPVGLTSHAIALSEARDTVAFAGRSADGTAVAIQGVGLASGTRTEWVRLPTGSIVRSLRFSADGAGLLFVTVAPVPAALTGVEDTNGLADAYLYDFAKATARLCSVDPSGRVGGGEVDRADLSDDARWVVFRSRTPSGTGEWFPEPAQVYVHEIATGRTTLLSAESSAGLPGNGPSSVPGISGDGRVVVFSSAATDLVPGAGDGNGGADVFAIGLVSSGGGDTDGDGLPDAWETLRFGGLSESGSGDPDRDGQSNASEYEAGTDPTDPGSVFRIEVRGGPGAVLELQWLSVEGVTYSVEFATALESARFAPVPPELKGDGARKSVPVPSSSSEGYYRVRVRRE